MLAVEPYFCTSLTIRSKTLLRQALGKTKKRNSRLLCFCLFFFYSSLDSTIFWMLFLDSVILFSHFYRLRVHKLFPRNILHSQNIMSEIYVKRKHSPVTCSGVRVHRGERVTQGPARASSLFFFILFFFFSLFFSTCVCTSLWCSIK